MEKITDEVIYKALADRKKDGDTFDLSKIGSIRILDNVDQFKGFSQGLRQDEYSQEKLGEMGILSKLNTLRLVKNDLSNTAKLEVRTGFIVAEEPGKKPGDGKGKWHVFSYVALYSPNWGNTFFLDRYLVLNQ